jgi:hypothetical protein
MPARVVTIAKAEEESTALGELEEKMVAKTNRFGVLAAVGLVVLMVVVEVRPCRGNLSGQKRQDIIDVIIRASIKSSPVGLCEHVPERSESGSRCR